MDDSLGQQLRCYYLMCLLSGITILPGTWRPLKGKLYSYTMCHSYQSYETFTVYIYGNILKFASNYIS